MIPCLRRGGTRLLQVRVGSYRRMCSICVWIFYIDRSLIDKGSFQWTWIESTPCVFGKHRSDLRLVGP